MGVLISPGSGPVQGAAERTATANMRRFVRDVGLKGVRVVRVKKDDGGGRYAFDLVKGKRRCDVLMPGLPLKILCSPTGLPPRLYIGGNSWMWFIGVDVARDTLTGRDDDV